MIVFLIIVLILIAAYAFVDMTMEDHIREINPPLYERWVEFDLSWKSLFFSGLRGNDEDEEEDSDIEVPVSSDAPRQPSAADRKERSAPRVSSADRQKACYPQLVNPNDARPKVTSRQIQTMKALENWEGILRVRLKGRSRREIIGLDLQGLVGCRELLLASSAIETSIQQVLMTGLDPANLSYYDDLCKRSKDAGAICKYKQKELYPLFVTSEDLYKRVNSSDDSFWLSEKEDNQTLNDVYNAVHDTIRLLEAHVGVLKQLNLTLCDHIGNDLGREGRAWATQMLHGMRDDEDGGIRDMTA